MILPRIGGAQRQHWVGAITQDAGLSGDKRHGTDLNDHCGDRFVGTEVCVGPAWPLAPTVSQMRRDAWRLIFPPTYAMHALSATFVWDRALRDIMKLLSESAPFSVLR